MQFNQHIKSLDEQQIVNMKYFQNKFTKKVKTPWPEENDEGMTTTEHPYATVKYSDLQTVSRSETTMPYQPAHQKPG